MKTIVAVAILLGISWAVSAEGVKALYKAVKLTPYDVGVSCVQSGDQPQVTRYNRLIVVSCGR